MCIINSIIVTSLCLLVGGPPLKVTLTSKEKAQQRRAIDRLQQHCRSMQDWSTNLQTDEHMLAATADLSFRRRQAISARLEQKKLIQAAKSILQTYKDFVTGPVVLGGVLRR